LASFQYMTAKYLPLDLTSLPDAIRTSPHWRSRYSSPHRRTERAFHHRSNLCPKGICPRWNGNFLSHIKEANPGGNQHGDTYGAFFQGLFRKGTCPQTWFIQCLLDDENLSDGVRETGTYPEKQQWEIHQISIGSELNC
jgi:hypothetical protein